MYHRPALAWKVVLREGVSGSYKKNDLNSNRGPLLTTCVLLDTAFPPACFSLCSAFSMEICILLSCYSKRFLCPCPLCVCVFSKKFSLFILKSSVDSSSPAEHRYILLFYISIQSFTPGFPFDYFMNQHPMTPDL